MRTITIKLEDRFAVEVERFQQEMGYATRSELVRDALRVHMTAARKRQLEASLRRYLQDQQALAEAADEVEARMSVTEEALARVEA
jgi:metal-responsive CopG/Arc/MetJ family transcriptional regulator